jgi:GTP cyclohydrolase I
MTDTTDAAAIVTAVEAVTSLLRLIGEDPTRDGLVDTPKRVVRALMEMTSGYTLDPADVLTTTFDVGCDELVIVRDIEFSSLCEHHLLPFTGTATVGYLPGDFVVGLSKIARLVHVYARRLQVQERMTNEIAQALMAHAEPRGVAVVVEATHCCMATRGVRSSGRMVTSALVGELRTNPELRAEFLTLGR